MASITLSQYGKYMELQNVSGSGDPADAPEGGIYLFASGTSAAPNSARLYMQNEGGVVTDVMKTLDIDAFDALGGAGLHQTQDHFVFSDNGTEKKITFSNLQDAVFADVSGDATIAAGGALTIAAQAVENSMLADDAVGADELAANAVVEASIVDNAVTLAKMAGITRGSIILGDSSGDPSLLAKGTAAQFLQSDGTDPSYVSISGDATVAAGGALTIGTGVVEHAMLAADCIDGDNIQDDVVNSEHLAAGAIDTEHLADNQVTLAKMAGLAAAKFILGDSNGDPAAVTMSGDATLSNAGALTIAANAVEGSMLNSNVAGSGLDYSSNELSVDVSDFMANGADNRIVTATGADAMNGEANLTFDGSVLAVAGTVSGSSSLHAVGAITGGSTLAVSGSTTLQAFSATAATLSGLLSSSAAAHIVGAATFGATIAASGTIQAGSHLIAGGNSIVDGGGNSSITFDGSGNTAVVNGMSVAGGYGSTGFTVSPAGAIQANGGATIDGAVSVGGGYGSTGATISAAGALQLNSGLTVDDAATFGGGYGSTGVTISNAGVIQMDGALSVGSDGAGSDFKAFGAAANEYMLYDASENLLQLGRGGSVIVSLGGDADSEYAIDVANGSDNKNKVRAAAFVTYSDESLKSDVATMNTALDTVMSLNGVEFTWKDSGERDFGFIAQDVQSVLPKAVHVAEDGVQGVDYSRLTSVLVEAVKAQQVQIDDLKKALKK
jgi:hypothetical protein